MQKFADNNENQVELVEYDDKYAAGISEMWNNSKNGWNGENWIPTEEAVINEEGASVNIQLILVKLDKS